MKTAALTAWIALGGFAPLPVTAQEPLVELELSLGRTRLPVFILEAESRSGQSFKGTVSWSVNGMPFDESSAQAFHGDLLEIRILPLSETALVCADLRGWMGAEGPEAAAVEGRSCAIWAPWDGPLEATFVDDRLREPEERPRPLLQRRLRIR